MKIIGLRRVDYVPKGRTKPTTGWAIHVTFEKKGVEGLAVKEAFITDDRLYGEVPQLGGDIKLIYDDRGWLDEVQLISADAS